MPSVASVALAKAPRALANATAPGETRKDGPICQTFDDGFTYFRWDRHFEFLIDPAGRHIVARSLRPVPSSAFDSYLLGPALSFALLKQGIEPLHATTVVVDGEALGILGDSGYGKSTLAASFITAGGRLLTDDLQVIGRHQDVLLAYPGPPRLKLFRTVAEKVLRITNGVALDSPFAPKLVITLKARQRCGHPVPLRALYVLGPPAPKAGTRVTLTRLSGRRAFVELVRNTFNTTIVDRQRMERQLSWCAHLAARVPVIHVSYPRRWQVLPDVRELILEDASRTRALISNV
jgi:hypothetical protein